MQQIPLKDINRLAVPAILAGVAEPLISLADTAIIGHLGTVELGGVGVASSFFTFVIWTLAQTRTAISALVSQYLGRGKLSEIKTLVPQALFFNLLIGIGVLVATRTFSSDIFSFYEAKGAILDNAERYFAIRSWGFPVVLATFTLFGVFRGMQNTVYAMQISIVGGVLNVLLDFAFVYGIDGIIPAYGVEGAAIASLIAQFVMLALAVVVLLKHYNHVFEWSATLNREFRSLIKMSVNLFIRVIALNSTFFFATRFAASYGDAHIAANTIAINIWTFSAFFLDGYATAGNAIGGRLMGAQDFKGLYVLGWRLIRIGVLIGVALSLVYAIAYPVTGALFSDEPDVIHLFNEIYWLVILMQPLNSIAFTLDGIFKGLGKTAILRNVLLTATFLGFIPVLFALDYFGLELLSVWFAFLGWMIVRSGVLIWTFQRYYGQE